MSYAKQHDIGSVVKNVVAIIPFADDGDAAVAGPVIARGNYLSGKLTLSIGAAAGSPTSYTCVLQLQQSATSGGTYADVSGAVTATLDTDDTSASVDVDLSGLYGYLKAEVTTSFTDGTNPTLPVAAILTLGGADVLPAA